MATDDPLVSLLVAALRASATGTELTDPEARILWVNRAFCELTGYAPEEVIGQFPTMLRPHDADPAHYEGVHESMARGEVWRAEIRRRRKDGSVYDASITMTPVMDASGVLTHVIAHHDDITERRRTERALSEARQLALQAERLASIGTLAAGVGHELNNPLAYVMASLEFVAEKLGELATARLSDAERTSLQEAEQGASDALDGVRRMRDVVGDLRTFSRVEGETSEVVDLHAVIRSALNLAKHEIRHRAEVVEDLGTVPRVWASPARLAQVFVNLLVNAAQAVEHAPSARHEVVVRTRTSSSGWAIVEVSDTGGGVAREVEERIFDPFVTTKPALQGTGLGLSICKNLVTAANGTIELDNRPGEGATFRVSLPPTTT